MARPKGTNEELAKRRSAALELLAQGWSLRRVASHVGSSASSVKRWQVAQSRSMAAPARKLGRRPRITAEQLDAVRRLLRHDRWVQSAARVMTLINRRYGVECSRTQAARLMRACGFDYVERMPAAIRGDAAAANRWRVALGINHDGGGWRRVDTR